MLQKHLLAKATLLNQSSRCFAVAADPKLVKKLRTQTGSKLKDILDALNEAQGDENKTKEILRQKGLDDAQKRLSRDATEGFIGLIKSENKVTMVEVNCETDFVAKTDSFKDGVRKILDCVHQCDFEAITGQACNDQEKIAQAIQQAKLGKVVDSECKDLELEKVIKHLQLSIISKVQENCQVSRIYRDFFNQEQGEFIGTYMHDHVVKEDGLMIGKIGSVVKIGSNGKQDMTQTANNLAMHNAAMKPLALRMTDEAVTDLSLEKKQVMMEQDYILSEKSMKVEKFLKMEKGAPTVIDFSLFALK